MKYLEVDVWNMIWDEVCVE